MSESTFSFTTKLNGDLLTVRGDTVEDFANNAEDLISKLGVINELQEAVRAVAVAGAGLSAATPPLNTPVGGTQPAPADFGPVTQGPEQLTDRWGNQWTYGLPDAPALPDGRGNYALKVGTTKAGKPYKAWFDPAKGPKPFTKGSVEAEPQWIR